MAAVRTHSDRRWSDEPDTVIAAAAAAMGTTNTLLIIGLQ